MMGLQYRYVGRYWRRGQRKKKTTEKKRVGFSVSVFLGNRKNDFKKSVFGREKPRKTDRKKRLSVFGSKPTLAAVQHSSTGHVQSIILLRGEHSSQ